MQFILVSILKQVKIFIGGTRAEKIIIPTHYGAESFIIPTRASLEISNTALYLTLKKTKGGKER